MSTDYIDRDLISRQARGHRRDAGPSTADLREERASDLRADKERLAALEQETAATKALIEKQEAYENARDELAAAIAAAQERIADEQQHTLDLQALLEESSRDLQASQRLMENLHEEEWTDATRSLELDHALATLDDVRVHYNEVARRLQEETAAHREGVAEAMGADGNAAKAQGGWGGLLHSPSLRAGWAWALGAAIPLGGLILLLSVAWWIFLCLWW